MLELIQFPWSNFSLVQRRILEYAGARFKTVNIPSTDRSLVWRLSRGRYYNVPVLRDGKTVVFEMDHYSQVIAKYIDGKFQLNLFPSSLRGIDRSLWRFIEDAVEDPCFKLCDIYWKELVPRAEHCAFIRHKERKFGRGCLDQWREQEPRLLEQLTDVLVPFECMLAERPYLLHDHPHFIDFDLWGMLAGFLYPGHFELPAAHTRLNEWFARLSHLKKDDLPSEKLYT
jgi:glutathione S-transferase